MLTFVMKIIKLILASAMVVLATTVFAAPEKTSTFEASENAVGAALQEAKYLMNGKAKPDAKYYIFLYSASWCPPCRKEMPEISKIYKKKISKDPKVELVHFSRDTDQNAAKSWAKKEKVKFPVISPENKVKIPGNQGPGGIPHMRLVKADGTLIKSGHGALVKDYESFIPKE